MKEGIGGFYTGLKISMMRDVPFSGLFIPIYCFFREKLCRMYAYEMSGETTQASAMERTKAIAVIASLSSLMANIVSCTITHPLDLIRTRVMFKYYNQDKN